MNDNSFFIPPRNDLNKLSQHNDPIPGVPKSLYVTYKINDIEFVKIYDECNELHINGCLLDFNKYSNIKWECLNSMYDSKYNLKWFDFFLSNVYFSKKLLKIENDNFNSYNIDKLNVIHIRAEYDAITFWSRINMIPENKFRQVIQDKYIGLVKEHFDKSIPVLVLSMDENNAVNTFMKNNGYKVIMQSKDKVQGRDTNAILDFLAGTRCTNCFIGNLNPNDNHGSTFSYAIINSLNSNVKKIGIDLDRIYDDEYKIVK
jgi:hypothetical protein